MAVTVLREKQSNIGIAYSTKDRIEFTRKTAPKLLEAKADFYWIDGSETEAGKFLPTNYADKIVELHYDIKGGAALAILYALNILYQKGYEYIGLVENDVLLEDGWLERCMELFNKKLIGWTVGAVSARTYQPRIIQEYGDYAHMANLGAGMIIFERAMVPEILKNFRCVFLQELKDAFLQMAGIEYPLPWCCRENPEQPWYLVHDWFWEAVFLAHKRVALAPLPTMARNIDGWAEPHAERPQAASPEK